MMLRRLFRSPEAKQDGVIASSLWTALVSHHRTRARLGHEFMLNVVKGNENLARMEQEAYGLEWSFNDELENFTFLLIRGEEPSGSVTAIGGGPHNGVSSKIGWTSETMMVDILPDATKRARRVGEILSQMPGAYLMKRSK